MDKELYKKAKLYADTNTKGTKLELECLAEMLYEFAEPLQTQINTLSVKNLILRERNEQLVNTNADLMQKVSKLEAALAEQKQYTEFKCLQWGNKREELEAQIEKMKRCENCVHHYIAYDTTSCRLLDQLASEKPCEKWEMVE